MKPITVIADDLTGAAEMAGIGLRYGLSTRLLVDRAAPADAQAELLVINADTRWLPEGEASRIVRELLARVPHDCVFFKKVDSVMRGHLAAEVDAALDASSRFDQALLMPQNPTRGRILQADGTYLVEGVPLAKTTFASDPDHPARTSSALDRLARSKWPVSLRADVTKGLETGAINLATAETFERVREWTALRTPATLLVGAADAFTALLVTEGHKVVADSQPVLPSGRRLFLCGSTAASARRALRQYAMVNHIDILAAEPERVRDAMRKHVSVIVMSPEPGGVEADPREIEEAMGACAKAVVEDGPCDWIFVEGGATTAAVCRAMNWTSLQVEAELAPGVVVLKPGADVRLVIKPGSYAWPASVLG